MKSALRTLLVIMSGVLMGINAMAQQGYNPGNKVDDFSLSSLGSGEYVLSKTKPTTSAVVVIFASAACKEAPTSMEQIQMIYDLYAEKGVDIVVINPNDATQSPDDAEGVLIDHMMVKPVPYLYLKDNDQAVAKKFGVTKMPYAYILTKDGDDFRVVCKGAINTNSNAGADETAIGFISKEIQHVLSGEPVEGVLKENNGCPVIWKKK
ncbi:MAG TPA: redoxin domain-containing protein [Chitinophagaceae bacterium]|nr:redoxin domain-containing protein [Chitinophagaceae bacterium]